MKIRNIETRYYYCNLICFKYSTVFNIIVFGVLYYILYYMNFKDTPNCISSNHRLVDCALTWYKYSAVFYAKGRDCHKSSYKVTISG